VISYWKIAASIDVILRGTRTPPFGVGYVSLFMGHRKNDKENPSVVDWTSYCLDQVALAGVYTQI